MMGEVFVVDSQATVNLMPPKKWIKGTYLLYTLLGLALCGVFVEGVFIYQLYQRISTQDPPENVQFFKQTGENKTQDDACCKEISKLPSNQKSISDTKPAAFLHYKHSLKSDTDTIHWDFNGYPAFLSTFKYSNGNLVALKDGIYFLFSKVSFRNCNTFKHQVHLNSSAYSHQPVSLMIDNRYSCVDQLKPQEMKHQYSSQLVGVFKLSKQDHVFVTVSNQSSLTEVPDENYFGGFMI